MRPYKETGSAQVDVITTSRHPLPPPSKQPTTVAAVVMSEPGAGPARAPRQPNAPKDYCMVLGERPLGNLLLQRPRTVVHERHGLSLRSVGVQLG
jgi:hypothetical protein